jgi:hypothetical protein
MNHRIQNKIKIDADDTEKVMTKRAKIIFLTHSNSEAPLRIRN